MGRGSIGMPRNLPGSRCSVVRSRRSQSSGGGVPGYYPTLRPCQIPKTNEKQHGDCPDE
jgi:hypothetical protein